MLVQVLRKSHPFFSPRLIGLSGKSRSREGKKVTSVSAVPVSRFVPRKSSVPRIDSKSVVFALGEGPKNTLHGVFQNLRRAARTNLFERMGERLVTSPAPCRAGKSSVSRISVKRSSVPRFYQ